MTAAVDEFLKISGITKTYGVVKALADVSFSIRRGEIHTVMGENGAGKSTLMKIIGGETAPDSGAIELEGRRIRTFVPAAAHDLGIHMVHQELAVFENLTVAENIFPYHNFRKAGWIDYASLHREARSKLDLFGLKTIRPEEPLGSVALAGQQMVEILRCIVAEPKIIILDEPTSGLNDREADLLLGILKRLKDEGLTIIYISHRFKEIMRISDRITVLRDGEFVATLENTPELSESELINNMVGRDLSASLYRIKTVSGAAPDAPTLLEVRGLAKKSSLNPTDLKLAAGEIVGVFGLEGSGVGKLSRMMYGLEGKDEGELFIKGRRFAKINPRIMAAERVMYLNNNRKIAGLLPEMPVTDNLSLPVLKRFSRFLGFLDFRRIGRLATDFIKAFAIALPSLSTRPANLSGGNQQKVMLSICLVPEPEIVIVNEPTRGIDVGAKTEIHRFLLDIASKGVGIVIFSSELPELMSLSDRILVMRDNSVVGEVGAGDYTEQTLMRYAAVGSAATGGE
ncbi:MAG: sugar ABC transporter ATP-binding protein [Planctomycetota bacterium]|jgi:ABC-type sugar transport system ATPase subunit|nr:sugar ABC transporter ATP-binding protein [Planctomycetota bacterium]